jgi:hypothetical protein
MVFDQIDRDKQLQADRGFDFAKPTYKMYHQTVRLGDQPKTK